MKKAMTFAGYAGTKDAHGMKLNLSFTSDDELQKIELVIGRKYNIEVVEVTPEAPDTPDVK